MYTFLFRRILGPYLSDETKSRLHESINISLERGRLELSEIEFDGDAIAPKLGIAKGFIKTIKIRKLCVLLSLSYKDGFGDERSDDVGTKGARLVTVIDLDGVDVELAPNAPNLIKKDPELREKVVTTAARGGTTARYIESVISSMKLSVNINDLSCRITSVEQREMTWVAITISSVSFNNSSDAGKNATSNEEFIQPLSIQELNVGSLVVEIGECSSNDGYEAVSDELIRLDGDAKIQLMRYRSKVDSSEVGIDQDLRVYFDQEICYNLDIESLINLVAITEGVIKSFQRPESTKQNSSGNERERAANDSAQIRERNEIIDVDGSFEEEEDEDQYIGLLSNILEDQEEKSGEAGDLEKDISLHDFFNLNGESTFESKENEDAFSKIYVYVKDLSVRTYLNSTLLNDGSRISDVLIITMTGLDFLSSQSVERFDAKMSIKEIDIEDATLISKSCDDEESVLRSRIAVRFLEVRVWRNGSWIIKKINFLKPFATINYHYQGCWP